MRSRHGHSDPRLTFLTIALVVVGVFGVGGCGAETPPLPGNFKVDSTNGNGSQIRIATSGKYTFKYNDGAYSTKGPDPSWLATLLIYRGDKPLWDGEGLKDRPIASVLAGTGYYLTRDEAKRSAVGQSVDLDLDEGNTITLVAIDCRRCYDDNTGNVEVHWSITSD